MNPIPRPTLVVAVLVAIALLTPSAAVASVERDALTALYSSTGGPGWTNSTGWNTNTSVCLWYGVGCGTLNGSVIESVVALHLGANHLVNATDFPGSALGALNALSLLDLSSNDLGGVLSGIPFSVQVVNVSGNANLRGGIPDALVNGTSVLQVFDARGTAMSIAQPFAQVTFGNQQVMFPALHYQCNKTFFLNVAAGVQIFVDPLYYLYTTCGCSDGYVGILPTCELVGPNVAISLLEFRTSTGGPGWLNITGWTAATTASLCTTWTGIACATTVVALNTDYKTLVTGYNSLTSMFLFDRNLTGTLPGSLYAPTLQNLYIQRNSISGTIPAWIGTLPQLAELELSKNQFTGWFPDTFAQSPVTLVDVSDNNLTGSFNSSLLPANMTGLVISGNVGITGPLPFDFFRAHPNFDWFVANRTSLHGPPGNVTGGLVFSPGHYDEYDTYQCLAPEISSLFELEIDPSYFDYQGCSCYPYETGVAPNCVASDAEARAVLEQFYDEMGGPYWINAQNWKSNVSVCKWYGITCNDTANFTQILDFTLVANNVTGQIPIVLTNLSQSLLILNLAQNNIDGTLPEFLVAFERLLILDVSENRLTGFLPASFAQWNASVALYLADNQLVGNLTTTAAAQSLLPRCANYLNVSGNAGVVGSLPYSWLMINCQGTRYTIDIRRTSMAAVPGEVAAFFQFDPSVPLYTDNDLRCATWSIPKLVVDFVYLDVSYFDYQTCRCANGTVGSVPNCYSELPVLEALYNATNGSGWSRFQWPMTVSDSTGMIRYTGNETLNHCSWAGVCCSWNLTVSLADCDPTGGWIVALDLSNNSLSGTLPTELGTLAHLLRFQAHSNMISGTLGTTFSTALNLGDLNIHSNQLTGPLPDLSKLVSLFRLDLSDNQLSGPFGSTGVFPNGLSSVNLEGNVGLTGPLPFAWILAAQSNLIVLNVLGTGLSEGSGIPSPLLRFDPTVMVNYAAGNYQCPRAFVAGDNSTIFNLEIDGAYFNYVNCSCIFGYSGQVPQCSINEMGVLQRLYALTNGAQWNDHSGGWTLLNETGSLVSGSDINYCTFFGICCGNVSKWSMPSRTCEQNGTIHGIHLAANNLVGSLPSELNLFTELQFLNLAENSLTNAIPSTIGDLVQLTDLLLNKNHFTGMMFPLSKLTQLQNLNIAQNNVSVSLSGNSGFSTLTNLITLNIAGNGLIETFPETLPASWPHLTTLNLRNTGLLGTLPASIFSMPKLSVLDVSNNLLTGSLPSLSSSSDRSLTVASVTTTNSNDSLPLTIFNAGANFLSGPIPDSLFSRAENLILLDLSDNDLNGSVPDSFSQLTALVSLNCSVNKLFGPVSSANLPPRVMVLDLSGNAALSGEFPYSFVESDSALRYIGVGGTAVSVGNATEVTRYLRFRSPATTPPLVNTTGHYECAVPYLAVGNSTASEEITLNLDPSAYGYRECACVTDFVGRVPECAFHPRKKGGSDVGAIIGGLIGAAAVLVLVAIGIRYRRRASAKAAGFRGFNSSV